MTDQKCGEYLAKMLRLSSGWLQSLKDQGLNTRVYWNAEAPIAGFSASHSRRYLMYPAHVCVTPSNHISGLDKWVVIVFEMHNLQNSAAFAKIQAKAMDGRISSDNFVRECVTLEVAAVVETEKFLIANVEQEILDRSQMFTEFQELARQSHAGIDVDTGHGHREYYRSVYSQISKRTSTSLAR